MKTCRRTGVRVLCGALALVVLVLSYRSTTAILSMAGCARNPTEVPFPARGESVDVRENKPRPAKQRALPRVFRVKGELVRTAPDPLQRNVPLMQERAVARFIGVGVISDSEARTLETEPQYLRLFLPAASGSPHSPPG